MIKTSTKQLKFKSGATSIYAVVIATLLFSVITVSFIRIIISEANRTASDELAQMAYDAALSGVEDAKAAVKKYLKCKNSGNFSDCNGANNLAGTATLDKCDVVQKILYGTTGGAELSEITNGAGTTNQSYTCIQLSEESNNYRSTLSSENPIRMIPLRTPNTSGNTAADVAKLRISWHSSDNGTNLNFKNKDNFNKISSNSDYAAPVTLSATVIQTGSSFSVASFDQVGGDATDRAMAFLVPTNSVSAGTTVAKSTLVDSNRHTEDSNIDTLTSTEKLKQNSPQYIKCDGFTSGNDYACSATLELPSPYTSGGRNNDTFYLVLSLPYENPETEFSVEMLKSDGTVIPFSGVQYVVDATGRASDMYSRVEARLEFADASYPFPEFALQSRGDINKDFYVTADCALTQAGTGTNAWTVAACADSGDAD